MAPPVAYTEAALAVFMRDTLGPVADALGYIVPTDLDLGEFQEPVNQVLLNYGVADITTISGAANINKLRLLARVQVWDMVLGHIAGDYDFRVAVDSQFLRSQFYKQAAAEHSRALDYAYRSGAITEGDAYKIERHAATYVNDPYITIENEDR